MLRLSLRPARPYNVQVDFHRAWCANSPAIQLRRPFTSTSPRPDERSDQPAIKWYEQLLPWSSKRRRVDPNSLDAEVDEEARAVRAEIDKLNAELREMENPSDGRTLIEPFLAELPEDDQQRIREAIRQDELEEARKGREKALMKHELQKHLPQKRELEIRWELPPQQNKYLGNLNVNIYKASTNLADQDTRKKLWQSYTRCKAFLPPFLHLVPEKAWKVLCASQQSMLTEDPTWAPHLVILSEDMLKAGRKLDVYERLLYIEALRHESRHGEAIAQWQELGNSLGDDRQASEEYELLGVRLFASQGDPEKAEKIALSFLRKGHQEESRILIPILNAWAQRKDDIGFRHAWVLYLRFKAQIGPNITMEDYDNITLSFLNAGNADLALAAFKDMMLTGQETDQGSLELYTKALNFIGNAQPDAATVDHLNKIALTGLTVLPKRFQNKFFFGSWLKKLLGMGEIDAAASVIELMYERGVRPDAKHLNGIIGAWLRSGTVRDREAAEKMAWAMVHERFDFVNRRRKCTRIDSAAFLSVSGLRIPAHLRRTVSPATVETFALLLQHYARRSQDDNVQLIQECLSMAEIKPNTHFINHLLYMDLRKGRHQAAFKRYKKMLGPQQKPDLETFACLWDCEKAHLESLVIHPHDSFPGPRELMCDMMNWFSELSTRPGERETVQQEFSKDLYDQIIRCMCVTSDLEGTIVALYAVKESFGLYPDKDTARMVSLQVAQIGIGEKEARIASRRSRRSGRNPLRQANAAKIAQVFRIIAEQRKKLLEEHGLGELGQCDEEVQKEESLFILAEFLRTVLRRAAVDDDLVESNIEKAAWETGASGIRMEDPFPSYKVQH